MRNELVTPFWKAALESLPPHVRHRYRAHIVAAERWDLGVDALVAALSRGKAALARLFHTPRSRSAH